MAKVPTLTGYVSFIVTLFDRFKQYCSEPDSTADHTSQRTTHHRGPHLVDDHPHRGPHPAVDHPAARQNILVPIQRFQDCGDKHSPACEF